MIVVERLRKVSLREVWVHEARDFTPWLAANSELLGDVLGLDIEITQTEQQVGPYAVDAIGRDLTNNSVLIVENQLEKTNHTHLGQLVTYAANTDAVTIVWIAKEFTDEHRQAVDYLNELAGDSGKARFFAVEVSAVRIGDSAPAALLEVVAKPNEIHASMSNAVKDAVEYSGRATMYRELWRKYFDAVKTQAPELTRYSVPQGANWQNVNSIRGGWGSIVLVIDKDKIPRVEIYLARRDDAENVALFEHLKSQREQIEDEFGGALVWDEQEHLVSRRIMSKRDLSFNLESTDTWGELIQWMMGEHRKFLTLILPRVYDFIDKRAR